MNSEWGKSERKIQHSEQRQRGQEPRKEPRATKGKREECETIVFVPVTPRGELVSRLKKVDESFRKTQGGAPIKFIERVGLKLKGLLSSTDLWDLSDCGRNNCLPCGGMGGNWEPRQEEKEGEQGVQREPTEGAEGEDREAREGAEREDREAREGARGATRAQTP